MKVLNCTVGKVKLPNTWVTCASKEQFELHFYMIFNITSNYLFLIFLQSYNICTLNNDNLYLMNNISTSEGRLFDGSILKELRVLYILYIHPEKI